MRIKENLSAAHLRLANAYIENLPWADSVAKYDRLLTLFFKDPPYWQTEGYGAPFEWAQYEALSATLGSLKGRAILTLNDHPNIRKLFRSFHMKRTDRMYTVGGGASGKDVDELPIFRSDVKEKAGGLF